MIHRYTDLRMGAAFIMTDQRSEMEKNHQDDTFRIIWNRGAVRSIEVDTLSLLLETDHVLCVTPNQEIRISEEKGELRSFIFNREFYCIHENDHEVSCEGLLFYGSSGMSILRLDPEEQEKFDLLYQVFLDEINTKDSIQEEMLRILLKRLIIKCTRLIKEQNFEEDVPPAEVELIRKYHVLVEQHFREKKSVTEYADMLYKSPKTLSNLFSASSGQSPLHIIHARIILEAKRLMIYTDKTIKEISHELGYEEVAYFSRLFKKVTGENPSEFRKSSVSHPAGEKEIEN